MNEVQKAQESKLEPTPASPTVIGNNRSLITSQDHEVIFREPEAQKIQIFEATKISSVIPVVDDFKFSQKQIMIIISIDETFPDKSDFFAAIDHFYKRGIHFFASHSKWNLSNLVKHIQNSELGPQFGLPERIELSKHFSVNRIRIDNQNFSSPGMQKTSYTRIGNLFSVQHPLFIPALAMEKDELNRVLEMVFVSDTPESIQNVQESFPCFNRKHGNPQLRLTTIYLKL